MIVYCLYPDESADQGRAFASFEDFAVMLRTVLASDDAPIVVEAVDMAPVDFAALPDAPPV